MSTTMILGLLVQVISVFIVAHRLKKRFLSHIGAIFVITAFLYYGLTEILQYLFPGYDQYRAYLDQQTVDKWVIVISFALLIYSVAYSLSLRHFQSRKLKNKSENKQQNGGSFELLDWRILLVLTIPFYLIAVAGKQDIIGYWLPGLSEQFLIFGITLTSINFVLSHREITIVPVAIVQSIAIALISYRLYIIVSAIILFTTLLRFRIQIDKRIVLVVVLSITFLAITISAARDVVGRDVLQGGNLSERASGLMTGAESVANDKIKSNSILNDFVYRFDGNSFGALVKESQDDGTPYAGFRPLWSNFYLSVPNFLNPNKLNTDTVDRDEELYMDRHYGLPSNIDYIPTTLGIAFGYYGTVSLIIAAMLLGILFARADDWMQHSTSLISMLLGVGLTYCVVIMEQGVTVYFITLRGILTLYIMFVVLTFIISVLKLPIYKKCAALTENNEIERK